MVALSIYWLTSEEDAASMPRLVNAFIPPALPAVIENSLSAPLDFALMNSLWFAVSKFAFSPASFNFTTNWFMVISEVRLISLSFPSAFTLIVPSLNPLSPLSSPSLLFAVRLFPSAAVIWPPVRYAVFASCFTFSACVPSTALPDADTVAFVLSDIVAFFAV